MVNLLVASLGIGQEVLCHVCTAWDHDHLIQVVVLKVTLAPRITCLASTVLISLQADEGIATKQALSVQLTNIEAVLSERRKCSSEDSRLPEALSAVCCKATVRTIPQQPYHFASMTIASFACWLSA
jgi:hypothetical protein